MQSINITLNLNPSEEISNHSAATWLVNELKHNNARVIGAVIGAREVVFSLERPIETLYLVCFQAEGEKGETFIDRDFYAPLNGKMTLQSIMTFEAEKHKKTGLMHVKVLSWQKVDA